MSKEIYGATVGTGQNPQPLKEQIKKNAEDIGKLSEHIDDLEPYLIEEVEPIVVNNNKVWGQKTPLLKELFVPLTIKKLVTLEKLELSINVEADCTVDFEISRRNGENLWNETRQLSAGVNYVSLEVNTSLKAEEYSLFLKTSGGYLCYPYGDTYENEYISNTGSTYLYNNGKIVFCGTILLSLEKIEVVKTIVETLENKKYTLSDIAFVDGMKEYTYEFTSNTASLIITQKSDNEFTVENNLEGTNSAWGYTNNFIPDFSSMVSIEFDFEKITGDYIEVWVSESKSFVGGKSHSLVRHTEESGHVSVSFAPSFYSIYHGYTTFQVWLVIRASSKYDISNFSVKRVSNDISLTNISGDNVEELFKSVDEKLTDMYTTVNNTKKLLSPSGAKYFLNVMDDGTLVTIPFIPTKGVFFGNSLLVGNGYGMDATNEQSDYYYLINNYIVSNMNDNYIHERHSAVSFEGLTTAVTESELNSIFTQYLTDDVDLISIQLGDNVSTEEKNNVFAYNALELCKALRKFCPRARVVWHGMWYSSTAKYQAIQNACKKTGCEYIFYTDILRTDSKSYIGHVHYVSNSATRTVENVTDVVENSDGTINVSFTVGDKTYTSDSFGAESYSLSETTLTYISNAIITTNGGVASHPSDLGFKKIANKFLYGMGYTDTETYYEV